MNGRVPQCRSATSGVRSHRPDLFPPVLHHPDGHPAGSWTTARSYMMICCVLLFRRVRPDHTASGCSRPPAARSTPCSPRPPAPSSTSSSTPSSSSACSASPGWSVAGAALATVTGPDRGVRSWRLFFNLQEESGRPSVGAGLPAQTAAIIGGIYSHRRALDHHACPSAR